MKLVIGWVDETMGTAAVGLDGSIEYTGKDAGAVREYVERYAAMTGKTGADLLTYINDLPNSYLWTSEVEE